MFGYNVAIDQYCDYQEREEGEYGSYSESYSNSFNSISPSEKYPDVVSTEDIKPDEDCFVVWAEWSTGDSFGSSSNYYTEALAVFRTEAEAQAFRQMLLFDDNSYSQTVELHTGQKIVVNKGWVGYFESLTDIHIEKTRMCE